MEIYACVNLGELVQKKSILCKAYLGSYNTVQPTEKNCDNVYGEKIYIKTNATRLW